MKYRSLIWLGILLVAIAFLNQLILKAITKRTARLASQPQASAFKKEFVPPRPQKRTPQTYDLVPEDPAKYGIISVPAGRVPRQQAEWDLFISKMLTDSKVLETDKGKEAVQVMGTSSEKFQDTVAKIDTEIAQFEEQMSQDPLNQNIDKRLQTLYKLKAVSKVLGNKVTIRSAEEHEQFQREMDRMTTPTAP